MKLFTFLFFIASFSVVTFSQIGEVGARKLCWEKSTERKGQRFVDWECGKSDQVVDCNESLESDPGSSLVLTRKTGARFTGTCETCHENGIKQRVVNFKDGLTDGVDTTYYRSGCTQVIRTHVLGKENGKWVFYNDSSGLEAWEINFLNGEKHGKSIYFSHNQVDTKSKKIKVAGKEEEVTYGVYESDTTKIEYFVNGKLDGTRKEYFPGSKLKKEVNYKEGRLHGDFIVYNPDGDVLQQLSYDEGEKDGEWTYYYNDGSLLKIENWDKGTKRGVFKTFYIQGHLQSKEEYDRKGRKHGWFEERFADDKVKREAEYKRGELIEEHVYDEYGNEIRTVGGDAEETEEDDEVPTSKKKRKWWQFWKKK